MGQDPYVWAAAKIQTAAAHFISAAKCIEVA